MDEIGVLFQRLEMQGIRCASAERIPHGNNNRVFRLRRNDGSSLIAKQYVDDERRRLSREFDALTALRSHGVTCVPRPIARFDDLLVGVYAFVEGQHFTVEQLTRERVIALAHAISMMHLVAPREALMDLRLACVHGLSIDNVLRSIGKRRDAVQTHIVDQTLPGDSQAQFEELQVFSRIERAIEHVIAPLSPQLRARELPIQYRRISPVDIGPHNILWASDGSPIIIDLEFAGWDHPARLLAQTLTHETMSGLRPALAAIFLETYFDRTRLPPNVRKILPVHRQLAEIEWIMILAASLIPQKLDILRNAHGGNYDLDSYVSRQLNKLRRRLPRLHTLSPTE